MENSYMNYIEKNFSYLKIEEQIKEKLTEKYNEKFCIKKIGDRYGIGDFDNVNAACCPENNKNVIFELTYNMIKEEILEDNFYAKTICYELSSYITNELNKIKKDSFIKSYIFGKFSLDKIYSIQEFTEKYGDYNFFTNIIIKDKISEEELNNVFKNIKNSFQNIYLKTLIYTIPENEFNNCIKMAENLPEINETFINDFSVKNRYIIKIENNEIIKIN